MKKLEGKTAFITGASKGIGEGIAKVYARYGANVVLAARSKRTKEFADELNAQGYHALAVEVDVTKRDQLDEAVKLAVATYGKIDILVSNAGVIKLGDFLSMSEEDRDFHIDVNLKGAWNACQAVLPEMVKNQYGRVVIMSSVTGYMVADEGEAAYAMTKSALIGLSKALAREYAKDHITVNAICPGYVATPMAADIAVQSNAEDPDAVTKGIADAVPLGRLADPEEVGELAAFLGSDESTYITGTQVVIDGGSTLPETTSVGA